ncbi:RNA-dependent RNA polymerase [Beihai barnacle virus 10]|uniref:RNA-dependent RNA polymerase n=1 Tax=Beihai barnacle virus 10 TaxID=1922354 RepID=UPI000909516D|nr:RNA-dependent RNA polymerase [Beihai barnacle virus 10]APG77022.1 RNA-dependent RNA polymerase [Beihai barnacle virus 10]
MQSTNLLTSKLIQTGCPRAPAGKLGRGYRIFIPHLYENGDYLLPGRNHSLLKGVVVRNRMVKPNLLISKLTLMGFGKRFATLVSLRPISHIERAEQSVLGVIDSLLLYDSELFITDTGYKLLKFIVKKTFKVAIFNCALVTKLWKEFSFYVWAHVTETVTREKPVRKRENFFFSLVSEQDIEVLKLTLNKKTLTRLAHLTSSRQFPPGERQQEIKSLKDFESHVTEPYIGNPVFLRRIRLASRVVGRKARRLGMKPLTDSHLSLAAAGSFYTSVKDGGRAEELLNMLFKYLAYVPKESCEIKTPFYTLKDVEGVERWRTWCRPAVYDHFPNVSFGNLLPETLMGFETYYQGFDEILGMQILACSYLEQEEHLKCNQNIPVRVLTITEPGSKARIVTTGPCWLYTLQQPVSHVLRGFLGQHPSAAAGLTMSDQAWQFLFLLEKAKSHFGDDFSCLSSDLTAATDVIPLCILKELYEGFLEGLRIEGPFLNIVGKMIQLPRLCSVEKINSYFLNSRGIFMGEPIAKVLLTLLNLSCEEIAIRDYLGVDFRASVQVRWRCFSVAGDDHIAVGPVGYLDKITETHIKAGSKISDLKHGHSRIAVRYCEKILDVRNFKGSWSKYTINDSTEAYLASPFVDSIKVRLLSPAAKNVLSFNEKNTAFGKGKSLGRTLQWLNKDCFDSKWISLVRDWFFKRMSSLLPDRSSGVYWHLLLPEHLGGLGLGTERDFEDLIVRLPSPSRTLLKSIEDGNPNMGHIRLFSGFTSNTTYRGYKIPETEKEIAALFFQGILEEEKSDKFENLVKLYRYEDLIPNTAIRLLRTQGWVRKDYLEDKILRPFLFKEILTGRAKVKAFNTEHLKSRYARLWDLTYRGEETISPQTLQVCFKPPAYHLYYKMGEKLELPFRGRVLKVNLLEEGLLGMPDLSIPWEVIGDISGPLAPKRGNHARSRVIKSPRRRNS